MHTPPRSRYYEHLAELCRAYDTGIAQFTQSPTVNALQTTLDIPEWHGDPLFACALANLVGGTIVSLSGPTRPRHYAIVEHHGLYFDCTGVHYGFELVKNYRRRAGAADLELHHVGKLPIVLAKPEALERLETLLQPFVAEALIVSNTLRDLQPAA